MLNRDELCRLAECLIADAIDQSENYGGVVDAYESMIDNLYDTYNDDDARAIMFRANDLARERGILDND